MWAIGRFLCNNIARMGLQNTTNMRDALMIVWGFLCSNIARMGLQNTTNMRYDACEQSDAFFVTILQGWVYKTQQTHKMHARCMRAIRRFLCNNIARMGLQNTTNTRDALMIVWRFLCHNIARMGWQNTTNTQDACEKSDAFFTKLDSKRSVTMSFDVFSFPKHCFCCHRLFYLRFSCHIRPRREIATFLLATISIRRFLCNNIARMGLQNTTNTQDANACSPNEDFGGPNKRVGSHVRITFQGREC